MTHPRRTVLFATIVALLGAVYATTESGAQQAQLRDEVWRELDQRLKKFYTVDIVNPKFCAAVFTVRYVYKNPHLAEEDKLFIVGPLPGTGNFTISPVPKNNGQGPWDHPWENQSYTAYPGAIGASVVYNLPAVSVNGHPNPGGGPPGPRAHSYELEVLAWANDCPQRVLLTSNGHGTIFDDPGHVGAIR